jgi:hypothetical protein
LLKHEGQDTINIECGKGISSQGSCLHFIQ